MAHYDIFREKLAATYPVYGHALWEPDPGKLFCSVEVGDVGYVREGRFHRLFNALLPKNHPSHRKFGVPEYHEPLSPSLKDHIDSGTLRPSHYYSTGIDMMPAEPDVRASRPEDSSQVSFLCTGKRGGAVLSLPVQTQREDTIARKDFGQWIVKYIDCWFTFARGLGLGIEQMEEILLVTGCHRTKSWTNVAFLERQADAQVSFGVEVVDDTSIRWHFSPERNRGALWNWGPDGDLTNLPEDQCIFIRGFRVARVLRILPRQLRGAAGPNPGLDGHDDKPDMDLISIPAVTKYRDPLYQLLEYVAKRAPDCNMVLVHDDDLARIDGICDSDETLQPDAVMGHLEKSKPEVLHVICDWLFASDNSPRTGTETVNVAMFSREFQEWNLPLPRQPNFIVSHSKIPHYTDGSPVVAPRTPSEPDSPPTEGIINIPQDRLFHDPPRTPSSDTNSPPPVLAMEQQPQNQRFPSDPDDCADLYTSSPTPDKYNIPPHHPAFNSSDIRPSNSLLTSTISRTGSPYPAASKLDVHSDNDEVHGDFDGDPLVIPPKEDYDPSKFDAPSSTRLPGFDVDFLSGVNDSNRVSISLNSADDAHPLRYNYHGYPSSSEVAAQSEACSPSRKHPSSLVPSSFSRQRRLSAPVTHARSYSALEKPAPQLVMEPATYPTNGVQQYILMSHGSDYALVEISSRGPNDQDPLLHIGEELTGFIVLSSGSLRSMQRMELLLQVFESNLMIPSGQTKRILFPQQVDTSHFSGGQYRLPFSIPPPPVTTSSASSSSAGHSSLGHHSYDRNSGPEFKLIVTMQRPGLFARDIVVRQQIRYVAPPDPSIPQCSSPISSDHPPTILTNLSWSPQKFPSVMVRGVMFHQRNIEVECKLLVPDSYPVSDTIPLCLTMTCGNREALDLVAAPDVIDVRLFKVIGFGEKGKVIQPFSLKNRSPYHRADLAAEAIWELDGHPKELPTSEAHPRTRWRIGFNGNLRRKGTVKLVPSFEGEGVVIRYLVCLYPFRAPDFRPASDPDRPLFMGNIPLRER